ncbi:MAG: phenylacetate--CoA ligase [Bacillota bacterium]
MPIFNKERECMSKEEKHAFQSAELIRLVNLVYDKVPFYKKKFDEAGITPADIKSIDDIVKIPFTTKQDLRDNYPFGLLSADREDIIRLHASSGTTGKPTVVGYTQNDIDIWSEVMARALSSAGATKKSTVHVAYGYGLFTGGLGAHYGAEHLGAVTVPASSGNTKRQIMLMQDFEANFVCCTPSYMVYLTEEMEKMGLDPKKDLHLEGGLFGAEPWTEEIKNTLESKLGINAMDIYGLSEIIGPGVSIDCMQHCGAHVQDDHFYPEIVDPDTLERVPDGTTGELVFTTITKTGMPLLRYRTRDISSIDSTPCKCGRTTVRMSRIMGRTDDMLIIRGINVFPSQIESVLMDIDDATPHYQLIITRKGTLDEMEVQVEMSEKLFSDEVRKLEATKKKLQNDLNSILNIKAKVTLVEPGTIPRSEGKAKRVIDQRNQ